ncbi:MAG: hypothetical protein HY859_15375 [Caulobacterales bacterium]|nr:hypothetical protein [Caulobacterales bacterium]
MRILTIAVVALTAAAATTAAFAAEGRLSDSQFIKASHCRGLAAGEAAAKFDALLKGQKRGRADHVVEKANIARGDGARLARTDAAAAEARLAGDCARF